MSQLSEEYIDKEVLPFLRADSRPDVRAIAMQYFLGLTGTADGIKFLNSNKKYAGVICSVLRDDQAAIAKDAFLALVNLTTDSDVVWNLLHWDTTSSLVYDLLKYVLQSDSIHADFACMTLSNVSRLEKCAKKIVDMMIEKQEDVGFDKLIQVFCSVSFNKSANLHYIGPFLSNLTQIQEARYYILDKKKCVIQRLIPYTTYESSLIRRGGIVGTLRNCCFETEYHEWLLSDSVDLLPRLLLPLAGPEEFDDDDMERLPDDLQYLEPDKKRETDPDIRKMLVESIHQMLATKVCREYIRKKNAYVILRELDNWEKDPACSLIIHKTISILIADEPEPGMENLNKVEIPEDLKAKLEEAYQKEQAELEEQMKELESS